MVTNLTLVVIHSYLLGSYKLEFPVLMLSNQLQVQVTELCL